MSKSKLLQEIDDLINGYGKKGGVLVITNHDCPPGTYRYGETLISAEELEQLRPEYDRIVIFTKKQSNE